MKQILPIEVSGASEASRAVFQIVNSKLGRVPNMYAVMANSHAVLEAYVKFNGALAGGTLGLKLAEMIALATAEYNSCAYCLSAHSYLGGKAGLSSDEISQARSFTSGNLKMATALEFAKKMLKHPGAMSPQDISPLREAGYTDGEILEVIANVVRNIFTNYINIVSNTVVDWPVVVEPNPIDQ